LEAVGTGPIEIIPIVDCRTRSGLEATLASIAEGGNARPILIGGPPSVTGPTVNHPRDLGRYIPSGAWICPMQAGDVLAPGALRDYARAINEFPAVRLVYADDDLIDASGRRRSPHFKPQWNPELFRYHDFLSGASVVFAQPETLLALPDEGWAEMVMLEAISAAPPMHLPLMLHHRRNRPAPAVPAKPTSPLVNPPSVSAIIPTRNHASLLRSCIEGLEKTDYPQVEVVVIDNGSEEPDALQLLHQIRERGHAVLTRPGPFNYSRLNNEAVSQTSGRVLCFLNNDVEMIDRDWLSLMVRQAVRPDVGAVGALLLYPDRTIQHAGVYLGIGGGAGHAHRYLGENEQGYFDRARLPQMVSAVTAACMVVDREKFRAVGGFDESLFPVAFNDVDLCLKLNSRGWQSFYEPRARLVHHESKSRGHDSLRHNRSRFAGELAALKAKWHTDRQRDPYHHPDLSVYSEQFVVAV
jgi:GT2 family glycosyltransferase